ncbi:MAG: exonuclease [Dictyoglomus sp.]|nr:exonuclease [Dictyoglomus sp.]MDW8187989.1 exonuclease [Dictyoglomus sp.]
MGARLIFYDGVDCIGGNKILLEENNFSILFDFGINFNEEGKYFDEFLRPRNILGIYDLLNLNLIPPLEGLYRDDLVLPGLFDKFKNHNHYRKVDPIGVLISHAHLDHVGYISYIAHDIPIITSLTSSLIIKSLEDTSKNLSDFCLIKKREYKDGILQTEKGVFIKRPYTVFGEKLNSDIINFWKKIERKTSFEILERELEIVKEVLRLGPFEIKAFPVDHSIPGALSFGVKTSSGWIVYTGDLRIHGRNAELTRKFLEELKKIPIKVLLCEGTHPDLKNLHSEDDVKETAYRIVKSAKSYVIADFGSRNIDRLITFLEIGKETGRKLLLTLKDIYLLESLSLLGFPDPLEDEYITFYLEPKGRYETWEENLIERYMRVQGKGINSEELKKNPRDYILCISYYDFHLLLDILPNSGVYIFSSSEAYNEEMRIDQQKIENWLKYFNLEIRGNLVEKREESPLHASGHIHEEGIIEIIESSKPEILIPIHTKNKNFFEKFKGFCKVLFPNKGEIVDF